MSSYSPWLLTTLSLVRVGVRRTENRQTGDAGSVLTSTSAERGARTRT